jgi:hypothetical protein
MKCPYCKREINVGALLGGISTPKKAEAARRNGKLGGWPKGKPRKPKQTKGEQ